MNEQHSEAQNPGKGSGVLVLAQDEQLADQIQAALREAAPDARAIVARSLDEAQRAVVHDRPDLFVLDMDAVAEGGQEFLYDLRTSHPHARAIILTAGHSAPHREHAAGLGAIHFLEKPFPHADFVTLAEMLIAPADKGGAEKFQGTLSDLHIADIIQLKCISGSSSALEFTGPSGEKARVYFEGGQVRHATAPGKQGVEAFNEIVNWTGGKISEVSGASAQERTINLDWQVLLMEAVRQIDETRGTAGEAPAPQSSRSRKILVIDDSLMLLSFVKEILQESGYEVLTAATAEEGLVAARQMPDLILLDYVLPDMKGSDVSARLRDDPATSNLRVLYMSGFGSDLQADQIQHSNVIGSLNKPFTSDLLKRTVENYMPKDGDSGEQTPAAEPAPQDQFGGNPPGQGDASAGQADMTTAAAGGEGAAPWWSAPAESTGWAESPQTPPDFSSQPQPLEHSFAPAAAEPAPTETQFQPSPSYAEPTAMEPGIAPVSAEPLPVSPNTFFSGDSSFFSLHWALQTIGKQRLTGVLRCFWEKATVELLARNGEIVLVTTRDPELYCPEAPITLVNVDASQTAAARDKQRETGCPMFVTLAAQGLILREPAMQLVQHYGQKLFAQLTTIPRVRFVFELTESLPSFANDVPSDGDIDQWMLSTLRFIQFQELRETPETDANRIPAYTRDGYERIQRLRLTVAEAQFASQFNGVRSIAQIAKNLRLDIKFARLTLFRFLALEIVECWAPMAAVKQERRGLFQRIGSSIGLGD